MSSDQQQAARAAQLDEKLWPSGSSWVALIGLGAAFGLIPGPISTPVAVATGIVMVVVVVVLVALLTPRVTLSAGVFAAGRAKVPASLVATVEPLDADRMKAALGPGLDARSFRCTRPWIRTGLRITLDDPLDPTPYWLISTRRPQEWVRALGR